jgi:hypothetical protein
MSQEETTLSNGSQQALRRLEKTNSLGSLNDAIAYVRGERHRHEMPFEEWVKVLTWTDGEVCLEFEERGGRIWAAADGEGNAHLALESLPQHDEETIETVEASGVAVRAMTRAYETNVVHRDETGFPGGQQ